MPIKKKKKYPRYNKSTSFRLGGEDYERKGKSPGLAAGSTSYKDHYDAA